jgi:hypothetical protein
MPEPRDVLADRITEWAGEESVYNYVDRLITDLDSAGFEIKAKPTEQFKDDERGAFLLLCLHLPDEDEDYDAEAAADALVLALNLRRREVGSESITVGLWPTPQWYTPAVHEVLMRARDLSRSDQSSDEQPAESAPIGPDCPGQPG